MVINWPCPITTIPFFISLDKNPDLLHLCGFRGNWWRCFLCCFLWNSISCSIRSCGGTWWMRSLNDFFLLYPPFLLLLWLGNGYLHITLNIRRITLPCMPYLRAGVAKVTCKTTVPTDTVFRQIHISWVTWPEGFLSLSFGKVYAMASWALELVIELNNLRIKICSLSSLNTSSFGIARITRTWLYIFFRSCFNIP